MGTLRDDLLPVADLGNQLAQEFGLSRFSVTLRRRIWSGNRVGEGTVTIEDIVLTPPPRVRFQSPFAAQMSAIMTSGGSIQDRYYKIDQITPAYTKDDGTTGGNTPQQLRMRASEDLPNVHPVVILVGDDGILRECSQVIFEEDRAFSYSMIVQETNRPAVKLTALAITPNPATLTVAPVQLTVTGTFQDGSTSDVTSLCKWTSSAPSTAAVDLLGVVSKPVGGFSTGSAIITAQIAGLSATTTVLVP